MAAPLINSATWDPACLNPATSTCNVDGATLTARPDGATFDEQNFRGLTGLGVDFQNNGQGFDDEINGPSDERIEVDFTTVPFSDGSVVDSIFLGHFYNPEEFSSDPMEVAHIDFSFLSQGPETLSIMNIDNSEDGFKISDDGFGASTAFASGQIAQIGGVARVERLNIAQGLFSIDLLFNNAVVTNLVFKADTAAANASTLEGSDYSLVAINATANQITRVPVPGALPLLLAGLAGLAVVGRRRKA